MEAPGWLPATLLGLLGLVALLAVPIRAGFSISHGAGATRLLLCLDLPLIPAVRVRVPVGGLQIDASPAGQPGRRTGRARGSRHPQAVPFRIALAFAARVRHIERFEWRTVVGAGDAAATSILAGALWAVKATLLAALFGRYRFLAPPRCSVQPDYGRPRFALQVSCIFRFTFGEVIVALVSRSRRHGA